jgi:hypothetical protein
MPSVFVPEANEVTPGVGIRPEALEANDLVPVFVEVAPNAATLDDNNIDIVLSRSAGDIKAWADPDRSVAILGTNNEKVDPFNGQTSGWVFVEWVGMETGTADLQLVLRDNDLEPEETGYEKVEDTLRFRPFTSLIVGFTGEGQNPIPALGQTHGMRQIMDRLAGMGYDVRLYDEDDVGWDPFDLGDFIQQGFLGEQQGFEAVEQAIARGVSDIGLIGYSHGGGAVAELGEKLAGSALTYNLNFVAYIDAVDKGLGFSEDEVPANGTGGLANLYNFYQEKYRPNFWDLRDSFEGQFLAGALLNDNVEEPGGVPVDSRTIHGPDAMHGIAENGDVQDKIIEGIETYLPLQP